MQALGIDFRILPVVRDTLFPFSNGAAAPSNGRPVAKKAIPPNPNLIKFLRLISDTGSPSTQWNAQSSDHHDVAHGEDSDHDQN